jgi:hypothetical protein
MEDLSASCGWYVLIKNHVLRVFPNKGSVEYVVFQKGFPFILYRHRGF